MLRLRCSVSRARAASIAARILLLGCTLATGCRGPSEPRGALHCGDHLPAVGALGPYSAAVSAGEFVFVSGKIGPRAETFEREVEGAFDALAAELTRVDLALADVVSATVYLTDMNQYGAMNAVYTRRMPTPYPARTCVAVLALPGNARIEIQVVARRP